MPTYIIIYVAIKSNKAVLTDNLSEDTVNPI